MGVGDDIASAFLERAIRLEGVKNDEWRRIRRLLRATERDLVDRLEEIGSANTFTSRRAQQQLRAVRDIVSSGKDAFFEALEGRSFAIAQAEAEWVAGSLARTVPVSVNWVVPTAAVIRQAAVGDPFPINVNEGGAYYLREYVDQWADRLTERTNAQLRIGILEGEPISRIRNRIIGSEEFNRSPFIKANRSAETLTRTVVTHVTDAARLRTYEANADVIAHEQWVSALDSRTSVTCLGLDGQIFDLGEGIRPPAHPNCRSVRIPLTRNAAQLRRRGVRIVRNEEGLNQNVPATVDGEEWFASRGSAFQDNLVGPTRAQAFRDGALSWRDMIDDRGRVVSLEELGL
ncbi:MAG: minor capsid protein [Pseudomonadota bacterium]